jgi:hypothetical protein
MAGQIIRRGDKTWLVRIFMGRDGNGKRRYLNKTIRGVKKEAENYLSRTLTDISAGTFVETASDTLTEYLDKWLETAAQPRLRENTYREYKGLVERYVKPRLGPMRLSDVRPQILKVLWQPLAGPLLVRFPSSVLSSAFASSSLAVAHNPCEAVNCRRKN